MCRIQVACITLVLYNNQLKSALRPKSEQNEEKLIVIIELFSATLYIMNVIFWV